MIRISTLFENDSTSFDITALLLNLKTETYCYNSSRYGKHSLGSSLKGYTHIFGSEFLCPMLDASQNCAIRIPNARATTAATVPIVDFVQCVVYVLASSV